MRRQSRMASRTSRGKTRNTVALAGAMALLAVALTSTSVAKTTPTLRVTPASSPQRAVADRAAIVIVLDGARWQDVVGAGRAMPQLMRLAKTHGKVFGGAATGPAMRASGPNFVSMPGYAEILGGAPSRDCAGNDRCESAVHETIVDAVRNDGASPLDAAVFASWPDLVRVASSRPEEVVVSAGRHLTHHEAQLRLDPSMGELLDHGADADAWPGEGDFRPDRFTAPLAERYLVSLRPRFLFVSLGEPDEYAHRGDRAGYLAALRFADDTIATLYALTHGEGAHGRATTILVTADHGRADDFRDHGGRWPESARSWRVALDDGRSSGTITRDHALADIAPTVRAWLGLAADTAPDAGHAMTELLPR